MEKNFKPVVGFDDNLSNHYQNYAHTAYAISKMRAGRTPKVLHTDNLEHTSEEVITDLNCLFRPGLYYMEPGATHAGNNDEATTCSIYVYNLIQDPDESEHGGHTVTDYKDVTMNFRQIQYSNSASAGTVTTRVGVIDPAVAQETVPYTVVNTVQRIHQILHTKTVQEAWQYAYVKDIAMWIRYKVIGTTPNYTVSWEPAISWGSWKSIAGNGVVAKIDADTVAEPNAHYVSFGPYTLTLPDPDSCPLGAIVALDQWETTGKVVAEWGGDTYEITTSPSVKTIGFSDMKIHDDDLVPDGCTFIYDGTGEWTYVYNSVKYIVKKVTLADGNERYGIVTASSEVLRRICYSDVNYPQEAGHDGVYWYDVNPGGSHSYSASDISLPDILNGIQLNTKFTINDVTSNVLGCTTYTFEVAYDNERTEGETIYHRWVLVRASDVEAYIARINDIVGSSIQDHRVRIESLEASVNAMSNAFINLKQKFINNEYLISWMDAGASIVYGDNAKVQGEELIIYSDDRWLDPAMIKNPVLYQDGSYIVEMFLARLKPVFFIARRAGETTSIKTIYLPTVSGTMMGKQVVILLEPGAKVNVVDDCSATNHTYQLSGDTGVATQPVSFVEATFEVVRYIDHDGIVKYTWAYTSRRFTSQAIY